MLETLGVVLKEFGPFVTLIVFFVYRDYRRELRQSNYIENLVANVVEIASRYNITTQAVIDAVKKNTKTAEKTYNIFERVFAIDIARRPTEEIRVDEDSDDNLKTHTFEPLPYTFSATERTQPKHAKHSDKKDRREHDTEENYRS